MRVSLFYITSFFFFTLPLFSFAQSDASTTATSSESGGFFNSVIESVQSIGETVSEQVNPSEQSPLNSRTQERLTNLAANISNRLEGLTDRIEHITNRLEKRITKLEADGYSVDAARTSLQNARVAIANAREELATIDRAVYQAFRSPDPLREWREVRATYLRARDTIRTAHTELRNTITNLKNASPTPTPTSTNDVTEPTL